MKPPKAVRVGPHVFSVSLLPELSNAGAAGLTGTDTQEIHVDAKLGPTVEREVVVHELLHAVWGQTFLTRRFPDNGSDSEGEGIICELAPRLLALLRDNPRLLTYLTS